MDKEGIIHKLRSIAADCGLIEERKWYQPCFTFGGANIVIIGKLKEAVVLSFFKGALLKDTSGLLEAPGPNTQSARIIRFTDIAQVLQQEPVLKAYIFEAIEVEKAGLKMPFKPAAEHAIPPEFCDRLAADPALKEAFEALTPGRQRGYLLHFSAPKQAATRVSRIEKCVPAIMAGKGMND